MRKYQTLMMILVGWLACGWAWAQLAPGPSNNLARHTPGAVADDPGNSPPVESHASQIAAAQREAAAQQAEVAVFDQTGSLLKAGMARQQETDHRAKLENVSFFAVPEPKPRTIKKHDLITVIINEEASVASDAKSTTDRDTQLNATLSTYLKLNTKSFNLTGVQPTVPPGFVGDLQRDFKGNGQDDRTDSFTTRLSAQVVDVKPNGTLVIQAERYIQVNTEIQHYLLSGVCRAEDVTPDNTILSTQLSDLNLRREDKGMVHEATKQGGLMKLLDFINPF